MNRKVNVEQIKAMKLSELGFCSNTRNQAVGQVLSQTDEKKCAELNKLDYRSRALRKFYEEQATKISVGDIIPLFEKYYEERYNNDRHYSTAHKLRRGGLGEHLCKKLVKFGLTRLDCRYLPQSTMAKVRLTKKEWLDKPLELLGTMSRSALYSIRSWRNIDKPISAITVRDLLESKFDPGSEGGHGNYGSFGRSFTKTCQKLRKLGFGEKDSSFMREHPDDTKLLKKSLIADDGLTAKQAEKIVAIALRRNWI